MVSSVTEEQYIPSLPLELWVKIFSNLCGPDLFRCEAVCRDWRQEIRHQVPSDIHIADVLTILTLSRWT